MSRYYYNHYERRSNNTRLIAMKAPEILLHQNIMHSYILARNYYREDSYNNNNNNNSSSSSSNNHITMIPSLIRINQCQSIVK